MGIFFSFVRLVSIYAVIISMILVAQLGLSQDCAAETSLFNEIRLGTFLHDVETLNGENDIDINGELLFDNLSSRTGNGFFDYFLSPRPHIGVTKNWGKGSGKISELYSGLTWDIPLLDNVFTELTFGGAIHDGKLNLYGCRVNFRESAYMGINLTKKIDLIATIGHMSNAGLCGSSNKNHGLTNAGIRLGYHFD